MDQRAEAILETWKEKLGTDDYDPSPSDVLRYLHQETTRSHEMDRDIREERRRASS